MSDSNVVATHLEEFRAARRSFIARVREIPAEQRAVSPEPGEWSARDLVAHAAAWLERANDRIPRLMAGAPPQPPINADEFNAAAVERAAAWTYDQAQGAFTRAADRYVAIVGESDPADLADSEDVLGWLARMPRHLTNHQQDIDRLLRAAGEADRV